MQPATDNHTHTARESGYELLRILAMLMIIAFHIMIRAVNDQLVQTDRVAFTGAVIYRKLALVALVMPFGHIGNDLFLLISGYFLAGREQIHIGRTASKLLSQLAYASILLLLVPIAAIGTGCGSQEPADSADTADTTAAQEDTMATDTTTESCTITTYSTKCGGRPTGSHSWTNIRPNSFSGCWGGLFWYTS